MVVSGILRRRKEADEADWNYNNFEFKKIKL